jgi:hypothetical protein
MGNTTLVFYMADVPVLTLEVTDTVFSTERLVEMLDEIGVRGAAHYDMKFEVVEG